MNYYTYRIVDVQGNVVKGSVEAETLDAARDYLAARGFYVAGLSQRTQLLGSVFKAINARKVKRAEVIEFANNLALMLKAGLPILTSLQDIISSTDNSFLRNALRAIKHDIEMGGRFSDAIETQGNMFPDIFVKLVRVGEETGRFEKSLSDVADHLQKMEDLAATIKRALIYPAFAIATTFGALIFWLMYVLPKIISTLKGLGVKLPLLTRILIGASEFTQKYWLPMPVVIVLLIGINIIARKNERFCHTRDLMKLKLPVVRLVVYNKLMALFSEQMRILVTAGLTIDKSLDLIANVIGNEVFKKAILQTRETVIHGSMVSDAMREQSIYPLLMIRMVNIGETSGTLDEQFKFLSGHFSKKLHDISENMGKIIEPLIVGAVGLLFAIIIMGLLLPVYDMVSKMGKG